MKHIISVILVVLTCISTFAQDFSYKYEGQSLNYTIISENDRTCQTKAGERNWTTDGGGYTGNPDVSGKLIIPEQAMNGDVPYKVVAIGDESFTFSKITSVVIPSSVTSIGNHAFTRCRYLKKVSIDNSVYTLGDYAFQECSALASIDLGDKITLIGKSAFQECTSLPSVTIPNSTLFIRDNAFKDCTSLKSIDLGKSVKSINQYAFYGCKKLISVTIPNSVESIGDYAFHLCQAMTGASIGESVTSIGTSAFEGCGLKSVIINSSILTVKDNAFNCRSLEQAHFQSIEALCGFSFANTYANPLNLAHHLYVKGEEITELVIPDSVTSIGDYVFRNCNYLTSVKMSDTVTSIGEQAFRYCNSLQSVCLSNSITFIGNYAFDDCINITSLTIPESVTSIGNYAFSGCSLISVAIPKAVSSIGERAFGNSNLKEILVEKGNPYFCSKEGVLYDKDITRIVGFPGGKTGGYGIPNSVVIIEDNCFYGCSINSIIIPNSVTSIGKSAFEGCSNLVSLTIPDSVTKIEGDAFSWCSGLTSVLISSLETIIDDAAFKGCWNLKKIAVPFGCNFPQDSMIIMGYSPDDAFIEDGILYQLDETMISFTPTNLPERYEIPNTIARISNNAFAWCDQLTAIVIPSSIIEIGSDAFAWCEKLRSVYYNSEDPIEINEWTIFGDNIDEATLYVPESAVEKCLKIEPWINFKNIQAYDFSGVETISEEDLIIEDPYEVYKTNGIRIGNHVNDLAPGIYIICKNNKRKKIFVK